VNRPFRTEPEASAELEHSALWYESRRPGLGVEFLEAVDATLERIARWPQAARRIPGVSSDIPARKAPAKGFPYHIAYLVMSDTIRVLAFAHDSREPGYWHSRMRK
jgi:toxin ParE1/3/4